LSASEARERITADVMTPDSAEQVTDRPVRVVGDHVRTNVASVTADASPGVLLDP
jgi:hypothetical protein